MSYLNTARVALTYLPFIVMMLVQMLVSLQRINKFVNNEELDLAAVDHEDSGEDAIVFDDANLKWGKAEPLVLKNISLKVKKGSLTAIVGSVGAGKSSLVS